MAGGEPPLPYEPYMKEVFRRSFSIVIQDGSYKVLRGIGATPVPDTDGRAGTPVPAGAGLRRGKRP